MSKVYPDFYLITNKVSVSVNGEDFDVLETPEAYFVTAPFEGAADVEVRFLSDKGNWTISPKRLNIPFEADGSSIKFSLNGPQKLFIDSNNHSKPLFFYGVKPEVYDGKATYYYAAGQVYQVGELFLNDGESLYIEYGAVVRGMITVRDAKNVKIYGYGVLDNSFYAPLGRRGKTIQLVRAENVTIENITLIKPTEWMVLVSGCRNVTIKGMNEIGEVVSSDGIDIVGSRDVYVADCMLRNNDDCVVIKFSPTPRSGLKDKADLLEPGNILVENCILYNAPAGNALEIGFELQCKEVSDITFRNIDIVRVDGIGAAFSIHVGDHATVKDILFEDIRVEHYYSKLVDFRVVSSQWSRTEDRGRIENIKLKDIDVMKCDYHDGYSVSLIGGYDEDHKVKNIVFENFCYNGVPIQKKDELELFERHSEGVEVIQSK